MKTCSKCRVEKDESEFSKNSSAKDRLGAYCKGCAKAYDKGRVRDRESYNQLRRERYARASDLELEKTRGDNKKWRAEHPEYVSPCVINNPQYFSEYNKQRRKTDPGFKMLSVLRSRQNTEMRRAVSKKSASTLVLTGCSERELCGHLELLFKPGMTWANHGPVWHIDHIKPCAKFDLTDPEQQKSCFHWTNLQPLFAKENILKGDTYDG